MPQVTVGSSYWFYLYKKSPIIYDRKGPKHVSALFEIFESCFTEHLRVTASGESFIVNGCAHNL